MMLRAGDFVSVFVQPDYLYAPSSATPIEARGVAVFIVRGGALVIYPGAPGKVNMGCYRFEYLTKIEAESLDDNDKKFLEFAQETVKNFKSMGEKVIKDVR